ncbi:stage III sporulation protein AD [Aciduricibacillus chroicocephali]|uniref:Stage III sporulation protein AD n=1 Tax=Aciduricibacillus chroicocephali TaxID=3054939 RepID=A0ABY9KRX8_9BACI|nr:stage III sporulation protein AD [Bacillaceae bacterium 44XB]
MDILQIVLLGIVTSLLYVVLKDNIPSFAFFLIVVAGAGLMLLIIGKVGAVFELIETLGTKASINTIYLATIMKIIAISYIAELGMHLTKDAGLESIASKIELAGKITILLLAVPIITAVIEAILGFLPV